MQKPLEFINPEAEILYNKIESLDFSDKNINNEKIIHKAINDYILANTTKAGLDHVLGNKLMIDFEYFNLCIYLTYKNIPIHIETLLHGTKELENFKLSALKTIYRFANIVNLCINPIKQYNEDISYLLPEIRKIDKLFNIAEYFMSINYFIKANFNEKTEMKFGSKYNFNKYIKLTNMQIGKSKNIYDLYLSIDDLEEMSNDSHIFHCSYSNKLSKFIDNVIGQNPESDIISSVITLDTLSVNLLLHSRNNDKVYYYNIPEFITEDIPYFTKYIIKKYIIKDFKETK